MGRKSLSLRLQKAIFPIAALLLIIIIIPSFASAKKTGHMLLLATTEGENAVGSTADLYIEILPGSGRVYIETIPLTKLDTQISTRFAKQVACDYLEADCSKYDFFYTIKSDSVIIGGPSAGAALAVLTITVLEGWGQDAQTAITGTINSGGFIGSVGGIEEKLSAAHSAGLTKVLIPKGDAAKKIGSSVVEIDAGNQSEGSNATANASLAAKESDLYQFADSLNITLIEVTSLEQAIYEFTGKKQKKTLANITPDPDYIETMKKVDLALCGRAEALKNLTRPDRMGIYEQGLNHTLLGRKEAERGAYYSSASYCFNANINFRTLLLRDWSTDHDKLNEKIASVEEDIKKTANETSSFSSQTLTDLQTRIIVHDRLVEAEEYLRQAVSDLSSNKTDSATYNLAYAIERHYSAIVWSSFFGTGKKEISIDNVSIKRFCTDKLSEAEERYQFAALYVPSILGDTRKGLDQAYLDLKNKNYELCFYKASRAKAEADSILSVIGLNEDAFDEFIDIKLALIENIITKEQKRGNFPILGFSYYEYAKSLRETDKYSSQLFAEYAIELASLDMYFSSENKEDQDEKSGGHVYVDTDILFLVLFISGAVLGFVLSTAAFNYRNKKRGSGSLYIKIKER